MIRLSSKQVRKMLQCSAVQASLFQLIILILTGTSEGLSNCFLCLAIGEQNFSACGVAEGNNKTVNPTVQRFRDLQSALVMIAGLEARSLSPPERLEECVSVHISSGHHMITAPVDFGNTTAEFMGKGDAIIHCNYTVEVDLERIFDPEYFYVNFTMQFVGSEYVLFDGIGFIGCPYPLRLESVRTVAIHNSTFQ